MFAITKLKEGWKSRLGVVIAITGMWLMLQTSEALLKHHQSATAYRKYADHLVDRQIGLNHTPQDDEDRMVLMNLFSEKLSPEEYSKHIDLINRVLNTRLISEKKMEGMERMNTMMEIDHLRLKMKPSFFLKYPRTFHNLGLALLIAGLWFAEKHRPKPAPPADEPGNPWDSVPAPQLKKSSSGGDQG